MLLLDPEGGGSRRGRRGSLRFFAPAGANASHDPGGTRPWTRARARRARGLCRRVIGGGRRPRAGRRVGRRASSRAPTSAPCDGASALRPPRRTRPRRLRPPRFDRARVLPSPPRPNSFPGPRPPRPAPPPSTASPPPRAAPARTSTSSTRASARPTASSPAPGVSDGVTPAADDLKRPRRAGRRPRRLRRARDARRRHRRRAIPRRRAAGDHPPRPRAPVRRRREGERCPSRLRVAGSGQGTSPRGERDSSETRRRLQKPRRIGRIGRRPRRPPSSSPRSGPAPGNRPGASSAPLGSSTTASACS